MKYITHYYIDVKTNKRVVFAYYCIKRRQVVYYYMDDHEKGEPLSNLKQVLTSLMRPKSLREEDEIRSIMVVILTKVVQYLESKTKKIYI